MTVASAAVTVATTAAPTIWLALQGVPIYGA